MPIQSQDAEQRTVLSHVSWRTYVELADQRNSSVPRMTYDRGTLELMTPLRQHEELHRFIGRLIEVYSEVRDIAIRSVASTTFRRSDLTRGFEADESYYIGNVDSIWRKQEIDLAIDPPPDLVVEVEITSSVIAKLPLFAAMQIPEIWRHDDEELEILLLNSQGNYASVPESRQLPGLTATMVDHVLKQRYQVGETTLIRQFRESLT